MSLVSLITDLATRIGTEVKSKQTIKLNVVAADAGAYTYTLTNNKETVITGTLPSGVNSTIALPTPVSGEKNESVVHFWTGGTAPTMVYSGFTPIWLKGEAITPEVSKAYTLVFEQVYNGSAWVVKASGTDYSS